MDNLVMETPEQRVMERLEHGSAPPPDAEIPAAHTFEVKNMSIWYGEKRAIDNVTLDVVSNAVTAIIGPSGCGKSTLLSLIAGYLAPSAGRVLFERNAIAGPKLSVDQQTILESTLRDCEADQDVVGRCEERVLQGRDETPRRVHTGNVRASSSARWCASARSSIRVLNIAQAIEPLTVVILSRKDGEGSQATMSVCLEILRRLRDSG